MNSEKLLTLNVWAQGTTQSVEPVPQNKSYSYHSEYGLLPEHLTDKNNPLIIVQSQKDNRY